MEFTKAENKIARAIFEISLQRELEKEMIVFERIIQGWREDKPSDNRSAYYLIYNAVNDFDKHVARRYDGMKNSWFAGTLHALIAEGIIGEEDLNEFSEDRKATLLEKGKALY